MTAHPDVMECLADETLAAFVDGELAGAERDTVVVHLAECGECRSRVIDATEFKLLEEGNVVRPRFGGGRWPAFAAAAAVAAGMVIVFGPALRERYFPGDIQRMAKAYEGLKLRPVQGRLSGGFAHHKPEPVMRGGEESADLSEYAVQAEAWKAIHENDDPHAVGVANIMVGRRAEAIAALRGALQTAKGEERTAIANDLAVALLWLDDKRYYAEALQIVDAELRAKRTPELLWNRAFALKNLERRAEAKRAWEEYLQADPSSPWAEEARGYLREEPLPY